MKKESIIVIGGGAAGLMAANLLAEQMDVTVVEAQPEAGGRIRSIRQGGRVIEAGAEFIHGKLSATLNLLAEAGIATVPVNGRMLRHRNGAFIETDEMVRGWDKLLHQIKSLEQDMTVQEFLAIYYAGPADAAFRKEITGFAEGFDVADVSKASIKSLYKEWSAEEEDNYRIPRGYGAMIKYLEQQLIEKGGKFITGKAIRQVDWQAGEVTAYTLDGEHFTADKILLTIPVGVLARIGSEASINFTPEIDPYQKAAGEIGYGGVIKMILEFNHRFWPADTGFIISDAAFRTWWTQLPNEAAMLTGWIGGPAAEAMSGKADDELLAEAINSLSAIFDIAVYKLEEALITSHVFNWQQNQYALGAYSYNTLGSPAAKNLLNTPLDNTLFFAGEALYTGDHPGTVEAALLSAREAAKDILDGLK